MPDAFIARQPIFDRERQAVAYELLYRHDENNFAIVKDPVRATSDVLLHTFLNIGIDRLVGGRPAYVNFTRPFLTGELPLPFAPEHVVIEILESVRPDRELVEGIERLARAGYRIALDDFVMDDAWMPLLQLADVVKLDVQAYTAEELEALVGRLREYPIRLLAEKVETHAEYDACREMGFHLFQGYFFCEPHIVRGMQVSASRITTLQLLQMLNDPAFSFRELAKLIGTDVALVYKLLRYINSAFFGLSRKVESIQQALVLLGERNVRVWLSLIALARTAADNRELLLTSLVRARMCELLADRVGGGAEREKYFLAGLLYSADAFLQRPLSEVLESINLADDLREAILRHQGPIGGALLLVVDVERGHLDNIHAMGLAAEAVNASYLQAIEWASESLAAIEK